MRILSKLNTIGLFFIIHNISFFSRQPPKQIEENQNLFGNLDRYLNLNLFVIKREFVASKENVAGSNWLQYFMIQRVFS